MEELQRQQQGLTDPEGQGWIFSMKLTVTLSFYKSKIILVTSKLFLDTFKMFWTWIKDLVLKVIFGPDRFGPIQNSFGHIEGQMLWHTLESEFDLT